jgi:phosphate:Na+ symporter
MIAQLLGGLGLFLLGMTLMTDGLKAVAGGALRDLLARFTGGPVRAVLSGAGLTALVQSSSATMLATVGFVSAGLLTFQQGIGVVFGAAIGTTSTGWLVAFIGLRYSISAVALPVLGAAVLVRLLSGGRTGAMALAVAGFALIFVGIDTLQAGMGELSGRIDLDRFGGDTLGGAALLVAVGVLTTVVMQSSSAAVATTLTAAATGTIDLTQALLLVIGHNVGTTATSALAAIGASVQARRTALAHILLNAISAVAGLALLPLVLPLLRGMVAEVGLAGSIALYHTLLNVVGVALVLPVVGPYARLIRGLVRDQGSALTRNLDPSVHQVPAVAVEAARRTVGGIGAETLRVARARLDLDGGAEVTGAEAEARAALEETRAFLGGVRSTPDHPEAYTRHVSILHALDHVERLQQALLLSGSLPAAGRETSLQRRLVAAAHRLHPAEEWLRAGRYSPGEPVRELERLSRELTAWRTEERPRIMARTAAGTLEPELALRQLDALRWVERCAYHVWRTCHHLADPSEPADPGEILAPAEPAPL